MPSINLEMMKQLMQEFSEKEASTTEEIGVIETELVNLEKRIGFCHEKLKNLNIDKDKLTSMQERYASGNFSSGTLVSKVISKQIESPRETPAKTDIETPSSENQESVMSIEVKPVESPSMSAPASSKTKAEKANKQEQDESEPEAQEEKAEQNSESKENGDTIKSINDALKGLFRK